NFRLVVAFETLASKLTGRNIGKLKVRVGIDQANESLTSVSSGTNKGNLRRLAIGSISIAERRVGIGGGNAALLLEVESGPTKCWPPHSGVGPGLGREGAGLNLCGAGGIAKANLCRADKCADEGLHLLCIIETVPEHDLVATAKAALGLVKVRREVRVLSVDNPDELAKVLLDGGKDIVDALLQPANLASGKEVNDGNALVLGGSNNGKNIHWIISISLEGLGAQVCKELGRLLGTIDT